MQKQDELPNDPSNTLTLGLQHTAAHSATHPRYSEATAALSVLGPFVATPVVLNVNWDERARKGGKKKRRPSANGDRAVCLLESPPPLRRLLQ